VPVSTIKKGGRTDILIHAFLNSKLEGSESSANRCSCFTHEEEVIVNHCVGGAVGPKARLYVLERRRSFITAGNWVTISYSFIP
jgi:hypothetical protein